MQPYLLVVIPAQLGSVTHIFNQCWLPEEKQGSAGTFASLLLFQVFNKYIFDINLPLTYRNN